jgi:hypothetical protein
MSECLNEPKRKIIFLIFFLLSYLVNVQAARVIWSPPFPDLRALIMFMINPDKGKEEGDASKGAERTGRRKQYYHSG